MTHRCAPRYSALCLLLVVASGCSSKATVSGKVTYKNKPVVWGSISLIASDKIQYGCPITLEGTYSITNLPGGPATLLVSSPNPADRGGPATRGQIARAGQKGGGPKGASTEDAPALPPPGAWVPIPNRYADLEKSDLKFELRPGLNTFDINLK